MSKNGYRSYIWYKNYTVNKTITHFFVEKIGNELIYNEFSSYICGVEYIIQQNINLIDYISYIMCFTYILEILYFLFYIHMID